MNNKQVEDMLNRCKQELDDIASIKKVVGSTSSIMMFLTRYSVIKACGTIELAYKTIVADFCDSSQSTQIKTFISNKVRNNSNNPTMGNIFKLLSDFDKQWSSILKEKLKTHPDKDKLHLSLESLNDARNDFAHGGSPNISFDNVEVYFADARVLIELLDEIVV